jgi:hypothetical protein
MYKQEPRIELAAKYVVRISSSDKVQDPGYAWYSTYEEDKVTPLDLYTPKHVDSLYHKSCKENFSCAVTLTKWTTTPSDIDDVNISPQENNNQPNAIDDGHSTHQWLSQCMETTEIAFIHQVLHAAEELDGVYIAVSSPGSWEMWCHIQPNHNKL